MKKQLLSLFILLTSSIAFSQTIPNGGFESWTTSSYVQPKYYTSANSQNQNGVTNPGNVIKTTDASHGSFAVKMNTVLIRSDTVFGFITNGNPGSAPTWQGGIPYNQKPSGFRIFYKSTIIGTDSALVLLQFKKNGASIGTYMYKISSSQSNYTLLNKVFSPVLPMNPDTVVFAAASSNAMSGHGNPGNMFQIDSLSFTNVASQPAQMNGDFENWLSFSSTNLNGWDSQNCNQTTDKYSGTYALELQTAAPSFGGGGGNQPGNAITGTYSHQSGPVGGHPYAQQIDTLYFYYKYLPADPSDSAQISINFKKNGSQFMGTSKLFPQATVYTVAKIPFDITWTGTVPDSAIISVQSSKNWPPPASFIGSDLKVDNMYFGSQRLPVSNFIAPASGCVGDSIQLNDNSSNMVTSWNWIMGSGHPTSSILQNPKVVYNSAGTYTIHMNATNSFGSGNTFSKTVIIYANPSVSATAPTMCLNSSTSIAASGANTYTWNTGATTSSISVSPTVTTTYSVTGSDSHGCKDSTSTFVSVLTPQIPAICEVTTDSVTNYKFNYIYWNSSLYSRVDSFIIYRYYAGSGQYLRIGSRPKDSLSVFIDKDSTVGGPHGGNPNYASWQYKLAIKDSCGNVGAKSPYHQSIFVQQTGANFSWTAYVDSGYASLPTGYGFYRDDLGTGNFQFLASVGATAASDPNYALYPSAVYRVDALGFSCTPTYRLSGNNSVDAAKVKSHSNTNNNRGSTTGINNKVTNTNAISIYPNPATNHVNIGFSTPTNKVVIKVLSILGNEVFNQTYNQNQVSANITLDISKYESGAYLIQITTDNISEIKRIVKQ